MRQDPGCAGRVRCPLQAEAALIALAPLVAWACPAVGRPTRVHLLLALAHVLALAHLAVAAYLQALTRALRALEPPAPAARRDAPRGARTVAAQLAACAAGTGGPCGGPCGGADTGELEAGCGAGSGTGDECGGGRDALRRMLHALRHAPHAHRHPSAAPADWSRPADAGLRKPLGKEAEAEAGEEEWRGSTGRAGGAAGCERHGGAVRVLCGVAAVGPRNAAAWQTHVAAVDGVLRMCGPGLCAMAAVAILGGAADMAMPSTLPLAAL